jgi:hypothetical protein
VWTWTQGEAEARPECLILRIECNCDRTYTLSNAPIDTPIERLADGGCGRYFVERLIQSSEIHGGEPSFLQFQVALLSMDMISIHLKIF